MIKSFFHYLYRIKNSFATTIVGATAIGLWCGFNNITYQVCTETGMVLAGMIKYPPEIPFYLYNIKVYSLINQLCAGLIFLSFSPNFVNILVSVLLAVVSSLALSLLIFALNRNLYVSLFGLCMIINMQLTGAGIVYPILLYGTTHTYGVLGLSFMLLTVSLYGCRKYRVALLCTGIMPSIHPSWGCFLAIVIVIAISINFFFFLHLVKKYWKYFAIGFGLSIISLMIQLYWMRELPQIDNELRETYLKAFIKYWDYHRHQYDFTNKNNFFAVYTACIAIASLFLLRHKTGVRFLLTILTVATFCGFIGAWITLQRIEDVPVAFLIAMPGRYINFSILAYPALLIAILSSKQLYSKKWSMYVFAIVFIYCFDRYGYLIPLQFNLFIYALGIPLHFFIKFKILCLIIFMGMTSYIIVSLRRTRLPLKIRNAISRVDLRLSLVIAIILLFILPASMGIARSAIRGNSIKGIKIPQDCSNDPFFKKVSEDNGVLLNTDDGGLISLKTRRPIFFDMAALDAFPMTTETAKQLERFMVDVYGVSILKPPPILGNKGVLAGELHKELWISRTKEEWKKLGKDFNFTGVIVPAHWNLNLQLVAISSSSKYYKITEK